MFEYSLVRHLGLAEGELENELDIWYSNTYIFLLCDIGISYSVVNHFKI